MADTIVDVSSGTLSYNVNRLDLALNRIRLEIGDTDSDRPLLNDEEIEQIISEYDNFNMRVGKCCRLICSLFAAGPKSIKMEGFTETYGDSYVDFLKKATYYESLGGGGGTPWAGSTDVDFKDATEEDTSLVSPSFTRGMHDNH